MSPEMSAGLVPAKEMTISVLVNRVVPSRINVTALKAAAILWIGVFCYKPA